MSRTRHHPKSAGIGSWLGGIGTPTDKKQRPVILWDDRAPCGDRAPHFTTIAKFVSTLGAHTASIGLLPSQGSAMPDIGDGMFIGQHGSWNRNPRSGYKVIFVPFANGRPNGPPLDVLTGFLAANTTAMGRPVGLALDHRGALLVADDVGNTIWRVAPSLAHP